MPLPWVVGANLARFRRAALTPNPEGITQENVAVAARRLGLAWSQSTVAELERGQRGLTASELIALPHVLDEAVRVAMPGTPVSFAVGLDSLLEPPSGVDLAVTDALAMTAVEIEAWLGNTQLPVVNKKGPRTPIGPAERKAARTLGRTVDEVVHASMTLWRGRTLTQEREHRLGQLDLLPDAESRQRQRGHITRSLLSELRDHLHEKG